MIDNPSVSAALAASGSPVPVQERVARILRMHQAISDKPIVDCAISEYPSGDLGRVHAAVWLFTTEQAMEASLVDPDEDDLDFATLRQIEYVVVRSKGYDWVTADDGSRLRVECWFSDRRLGEIKASGTNCDWLRDVIRRRLVPETAAL